MNPYEDLNQQQQAFLSSPARELCYMTPDPSPLILVMDYLQHIDRKDWNGILIWHSWEALQAQLPLVTELVADVCPGGTYSKSSRTWTFDKPLQQLHAAVIGDNQGDYEKYRGHDFTFIGWNGLQQWADDHMFKKSRSLLKSWERDTPLKLRATALEGANWNDLTWVDYRYRNTWDSDRYSVDSRGIGAHTYVHRSFTESTK